MKTFDPDQNVIRKKPSMTFQAKVIDDCFVGQGMMPYIDSAYYIRIKPLAKIEMLNKGTGQKTLSNRMIQIPEWILKAKNIPIPKKDTIITVIGCYVQLRNLNFYFQMESWS
jgi:hypothetical protein